MTDHRFDDAQMIEFVGLGYRVMHPPHPDGWNERMHALLQGPGIDTGAAVTERIPELFEVAERPEVRGALTSLLGPNYVRLPHRNLYVNRPGSRSQGWHADDDAPGRTRELSTVVLFYYPHDVSLDMGPTVFLPGSHLRHASLDQLATYANIRGQRFMTVPAGTVVLLHGNLWHAGTLNRSQTPRFMMKLMFGRVTPPGKPTWAHDAVRARALLRQQVRVMVPPVLSFCSDALEEWRRRVALWNWLGGADPPIPCETTLDILTLTAG